MHGRDTSGEAFIGVIALVGLMAGIATGKLATWEQFLFAAAVLGLFICFYFLVLLCRAIHHFMVGNDAFWWEKYEPPHGKPKK